MRIGVASANAWREAVIAAGHQCVEIPGVSGNSQTLGDGVRQALGRQSLEILSREPVDFILDANTDGLQFVPRVDNPNQFQLLHERIGVPLVSHMVDASVTCFTDLPLPMHLQVLESNSWIKLLWDDAHMNELAHFGIQNMAYFPMASFDRNYDRSPLEAEPAGAIPVSFIGGKSGTFFRCGNTIDASNCLSAVIAMNARHASPQMGFYDLYYKLYKLGVEPAPGETFETRAEKYTDYQRQKLFYTASQMVAQRDRWVVFLKKQLGEQFVIAGDKWQETYGIASLPRLATTDDFFEFFRKSKININVVAGHTETGVNQRTYEITSAGGFMLHHWRPQLERDFVIGKECDIFRDETELLKKIQYYLNNPKKRIEVALAGQHRTLSQHLYSHRVNMICQNIKKLFKK